MEIPCRVGFFVIVAVIVLNFAIGKLQPPLCIVDYAKAVFPLWSKKLPVVDDFAKPSVMVPVESYGVKKTAELTTLDAHSLYEWSGIFERSYYCKIFSLYDVDCICFTLHEKSLRKFVSLATKHPEYRFVIRGDHRSMEFLEQLDFVQSILL